MQIGLIVAEEEFVLSEKCMKNLLTILLISAVFTAKAQRVMFGSKNNYVAPIGPPAYITEGLVLHVDA